MERHKKYSDIYGGYFKFLHLADGKLSTEDGYTFNIHRVVLAHKSGYFKSMFCGLGGDRTVFTVPGVNGKCLTELLRYIYTGKMSLNADNLSDLLTAADYLLLPDIHEDIKGKIKEHLTISNCLQVFHVSNQIHDEKIVEQSFRFIVTKFEEIIRTQRDFMRELPFETLYLILSSRSLYVYDEANVWQIIVEWTRKDTSTRLSFVPKFLTCLPSRELDENLSLTILQHEIVSQNPFMTELQEQQSSGEFSNSLDIFSHFLETRPNSFEDSNGYRIPLRLHIIIPPHKEDSDEEGTNLYMTYDENLDLWRKVGEIDFRPAFMEVVGHHVYLFQKETAAKFDFISKQWLPMQHFTFKTIYYVTHIDEVIYIPGLDNNSDIIIEAYDTVNDRWFQLTTLPNVYMPSFVALGKKMYMMGFSENEDEDEQDDRTMQVFDFTTLEWSELPLPTPYPNFSLYFTAYSKKIYLIGDTRWDEDKTKVKVFEPESSTWNYDLPMLPYNYSNPKAIVINNNFIVYDNCEEYVNTKNVRWNDTVGDWETLERTDDLKDFHSHQFATLEDANDVRILTKEMRNAMSRLEKSSFN